MEDCCWQGQGPEPDQGRRTGGSIFRLYTFSHHWCAEGATGHFESEVQLTKRLTSTHTYPSLCGQHLRISAGNPLNTTSSGGSL